MSDWKVRKAARLLQPGERFIFTEDFGGQGETLTVATAVDLYGVTVIETEEYDDCTLEIGSKQWVTMS
jgi:hypothetical protein